MTSHHESGTEDAASNARIEQLRLCFDQMDQSPKHRLVLFGGDLNAREKEVMNNNSFEFLSFLPSNILVEKIRSSSIEYCRSMDCYR